MLRSLKSGGSKLVLAQPSCPPTVRTEVVPGGEDLILAPRTRATRGYEAVLLTTLLAFFVGDLGLPVKAVLTAVIVLAMYLIHRATERVEARETKLSLRLFRRRIQVDLADVERVAIIDGDLHPMLQLERRGGAPIVLFRRRDRPTLEYVRDWLERRLPPRT
jgi:hypothetical protein